MPTKTTRKSKAADSDSANPDGVADEKRTASGDSDEAKPAPANGGGDAETLNLATLKDMSISELTHIAKEMGIEETGIDL